MSAIFISYNRGSESIAKTLVNDCEALGHSVWFDKELSGGQAWWEQILAKIRECDVFILVLNPQALDSAACKSEYGYAADLGKPILPILVSDEVKVNLLPSVLSRVQFVDYRKRDSDAAFRLARALADVPASGPLPNPLPQQPEVPVSYLGSLSDQIDTSSQLSYEAQSALVVDLKKGLRNSATSDDARTLLERLRSRRDLFAAIADEIDELLEGSGGEKKSVERGDETSNVRKRLPDNHPGEDSIQRGTRNDWKKSAMIGGILGVVLGVFIISMIWGIDVLLGSFMLTVLIPGAGGAIAGAISGKHVTIVLLSAIGAVVAWLLFAILVDNLTHFRIIGGYIYGTPIGAILGAIVGRMLEKWKRKRSS
ncbi:MAG: toll/interleukin-1 receptor domain-containing protein [Chlorobiales bacterium]|nr:toll/interleukin-1 receptor domain-containing protein [Chlorobiales bacterium]